MSQWCKVKNSLLHFVCNCQLQPCQGFAEGCEECWKDSGYKGTPPCNVQKSKPVGCKILKGLTSTATDYGQVQLHCISTIQRTNMQRCVEDVLNVLFWNFG